MNRRRVQLVFWFGIVIPTSCLTCEFRLARSPREFIHRFQ
jgi:hypothetical protein